MMVWVQQCCWKPSLREDRFSCSCSPHRESPGPPPPAATVIHSHTLTHTHTLGKKKIWLHQQCGGEMHRYTHTHKWSKSISMFCWSLKNQQSRRSSVVSIIHHYVVCVLHLPCSQNIVPNDSVIPDCDTSSLLLSQAQLYQAQLSQAQLYQPTDTTNS